MFWIVCWITASHSSRTRVDGALSMYVADDPDAGVAGRAGENEPIFVGTGGSLDVILSMNESSPYVAVESGVSLRRHFRRHATS